MGFIRFRFILLGSKLILKLEGRFLEVKKKWIAEYQDLDALKS